MSRMCSFLGKSALLTGLITLCCASGIPLTAHAQTDAYLTNRVEKAAPYESWMPHPHTIQSPENVSSSLPRVGMGLSLDFPRMLWHQDIKNGNVLSLQMGLGVHLFYQPISRITLDLAVHLSPSVASRPIAYWTFDTTVRLGTRFSLFNTIPTKKLSPYGVVAVGITPSQLTDRHQIFIETALFFEGQAGIGAEWRLSPTLSLFFDARGLFKARLTQPDQTEYPSSTGTLLPLPSVAGGLSLSFGVSSYF